MQFLSKKEGEMMRTTRGVSILGLCIVLALGVVGGGSFAMSGERHAQDSFVKWERIEGVTVPGNALGILNVVGVSRVWGSPGQQPWGRCM